MRYRTDRAAHGRSRLALDRMADRSQSETAHGLTLARGAANEPPYESDPNLAHGNALVPVASSIRFGAISSTERPRARATSSGIRSSFNPAITA
jgi:hypothetical protein